MYLLAYLTLELISLASQSLSSGSPVWEMLTVGGVKRVKKFPDPSHCIAEALLQS